MLDSPIDLTLFVPCLNEATRIADTLSTIRAAMDNLDCSYEVIVVDDGSTDDTSEVVLGYSSNHPQMRIRLHRNPTNLGLAETYVNTAFLGRGEHFMLVWGDGAFSQASLVDILKHVGKYDLIIPYVTTVEGKPLLRRCLSWLYTRLVNLLSGHSLRYYNGGLVCHRYDAMRWAPRCIGFSGFLAELITVLLDRGATCVEVPFLSAHTVKEASSSVLTVKNILSTIHTLLNIALRRLRRLLFSLPRSHHLDPTRGLNAKPQSTSNADRIHPFHAFTSATQSSSPNILPPLSRPSKQFFSSSANVDTTCRDNV